MTNHTPTPWYLEAGTSKEGWRIEGERVDGARFTIADTHLPGPYTHANAAFIVRAVNAHDGLVEDLAVCLQVFGKDMQGDFRRRIEKHLKEAIAKAEGWS